jgi:hypothetical protein
VTASGYFEGAGVPAVRDLLEPGARNAVRAALRLVRWSRDIVSADDHQRRRFDADVFVLHRPAVCNAEDGLAYVGPPAPAQSALPLVDDGLVCEGSLRKAGPNMMGSTCFRSGGMPVNR